MKRAHIATLCLLSFLALTSVHAQSDPIIPSDDFEDELFSEIFGDDELIEPPAEEPAEAPETLDELADDEVLESAPIMTDSLPLSATTSLSVVNISQDNANALDTGARPGDILRYEFVIDSQTEDVKGYVARVDVSALAGAVNFTDIGLGSLDGNMLSFPAYSQSAPCNQIYTFFVQVREDCGDVKNVSVSAEDQNVRVNLNCGLAQVGPTSNAPLLWGLGLLLALLGISWVSNRKTS